MTGLGLRIGLRQGTVGVCVAVGLAAGMLWAGATGAEAKAKANFRAGQVDTSYKTPKYGHGGFKAITVLRNGKLIGLSDIEKKGKYVLIRHRKDGKRDRSFRSIKTTGEIDKIVVQKNRRILIAGMLGKVNGKKRGDFVRLLPNGKIDKTFANTAVRVYRDVKDLEVFPDGRIVVVGGIHVPGSHALHSMVRLEPGGARDETFEVPPVAGNILQVERDRRGGILVAGGLRAIDGVTVGRVARLHMDGSLDPTFITPAIGGVVRSMIVLPDKKIVAGGKFLEVGNAVRTGVVRLNVNGSLDRSFKPRLRSENVWTMSSLAVQPDGKLVIGGQWYPDKWDAKKAGQVARLLPDGSLDPTFKPLKLGYFVESVQLGIAKGGSILVRIEPEFRANKILRLFGRGPAGTASQAGPTRAG